MMITDKEVYQVIYNEEELAKILYKIYDMVSWGGNQTMKATGSNFNGYEDIKQVAIENVLFRTKPETIREKGAFSYFYRALVQCRLEAGRFNSRGKHWNNSISIDDLNDSDITTKKEYILLPNDKLVTVDDAMEFFKKHNIPLGRISSKKSKRDLVDQYLNA